MAEVETPLIDLEIEEAPSLTSNGKGNLFSNGRTPPRRGPGRPKANAKPKIIPDYKAGAVQKGFEELYVLAGTMLMIKDPHCGMAVIQSAPDVAKSLEELAKTNPSVRRVLMGFIVTNAWGQVAAAHMPIIMALFAHHIGPKMNGEAAEVMAEMMREKQDANAN